MRFRQFFQQKSYYYRAAILGLLLLIIGVFYLWHTDQAQRLNASHEYEMLLNSLVNSSRTADITQQATHLVKSYPSTHYAQLALLQLACLAVHYNQLSDAEQKLIQVIKTSTDFDIQAIAKQRLARIRLATGQPESALELLDSDNSCKGAYLASCSEIKGDIFIKLQKKTEAIANWRLAQQALPDLEALQPLLQMKLDDLGDTPEVP